MILHKKLRRMLAMKCRNLSMDHCKLISWILQQPIIQLAIMIQFNIFMSFHEQKWLNSCPSSFKPLLYRRHVDDCFLLFRSLDHIPLFLDYLNRQHATITFTAEIERDGKLPFLDLTHLVPRVSSLLLFTASLRLLVYSPTFTASFQILIDRT